MRARPILLAVPLYCAALSAAVILTGCARDEDSGVFQKYTEREEVVSSSTTSEPAKSPQNAAVGKSANAATPAPAPAPVRQQQAGKPFRSAIPAGIGLFSLPVLDVGMTLSGNIPMAAAIGLTGALAKANLPPVQSAKMTLLTNTAAQTTVKKLGTGRYLPLAKPRITKLLIKNKTFRIEGPQKAIRVTYDDINLLKVLNMEPVTPNAPKLLPKWLKDLHGKRIRIRGFMSELSVFQLKGNKGFLMGRDNQACCFPGNAKVYDLFPVKMRDGVTVDLILRRPFDVVGIFKISPWIEDGKIFDIYLIEDAIVIQ